MSDSDLAMLIAAFDRLAIECDTPEKATIQLQREGIVDADGRLAAVYRDSGDEAAWQ